MPCYTLNSNAAGNGFICGELGPHCKHCMCVGDYLCDYPVGQDKTCDASICGTHATEIAPELHYCPAHLEAWESFRASGGVRRELANVVPFGRATQEKPHD
jgi:hypothetical protein